MKGSPIVELQNVTFKYSCHAILDNVSLTINAGDAVGITGPNGAGKSTLLKLILGKLKPLKGDVRLFGVPAAKFTEKYRVGYVPQNAASFNRDFPTTVLEAVIAGRTACRGLFKSFNEKDYALAEEALKNVGLYPLRKRRLSELSGGQQQRVFVARAVVSNPDLLILDEPTVGMDAQAQIQLVQLLKELNTKRGLTLLIVSHELELISTIINHQICLDKKICHCSCYTGENSSIKNIDCNKSVWAYQ
ncbi:zinc transport system ATP-binding protein [Desulfohalotomaculum tongense]|uniref:metal ABC transporter ATP-binding protein n=1 Tax=Desulforadius tongensis TaxID=1216062 RepID=UPI001A9C539A|nr:ABC transporter ATP-binding protein [Desulforadius tongensis]MBM7854119.1 zinc transport system ATP-binding protein [Desulforadius tongensis]